MNNKGPATIGDNLERHGELLKENGFPPSLKSKTLSDQEIISRLADALRQAIKDLEYCGEKHSNSLLSHGVKCAMEAEQVLKDLGLEKVE